MDHHYKVLKICEELGVIGDPSYRAHELALGIQQRNWTAGDLQRNAGLDNLYNRLLWRCLLGHRWYSSLYWLLLLLLKLLGL